MQLPKAFSAYEREGEAMREYHVDTHKDLINFVHSKCYGGDLSVRIGVNRPVLLVGQDETTFHQLSFSKKQWKCPKGKCFLLPKTEGEIYMVSGFQAREFGLGLGNIL